MTPLPWLALDTSADQASVAVGSAGVILAEETIGGSRRHAIELVPAIDLALAASGVSLHHIHGLLVTDGPGSFTGLRIGATVAKALAHTGQIAVRTASALLVIARAGWKAKSKPTLRRVLAVSDALRGEYYAALFEVAETAIAVIREPTVVRIEALAGWETSDLIVTELALPELAGPERVGGRSARPRASILLDLLAIPGATREIANLETWEPEYGRPAEAQARWEAAHGRRLPDSAGTAR